MSPLRVRSVARRLVSAALFALLFGQWTVLAHSIAHAPALAAAAAGADHDHDHDQGWGHDAGTTACDLLDHLLSEQAPGAAAASMACPPPAAPRVAAQAPSIGPGPVARAYEARAPPRA